MRGITMGYLRPTSAPISSSWSGHRNRRPPSQEPGTDYACAHGTPLAAPAAGRFVAAQDNPGNATGRYMTFDLDDGRRVRWLHLSKILIPLGARITPGQIVAVSGSSAKGNERGGDPHVHVSLFPSHSYGGFGPNSTIDFEEHVGGASAAGGAAATPSTPTKSEEDDDMSIMVKANTNIYLLAPGFIKLFENTTEVAEALADGLRQIDLTGTPSQQNAAFARRLDRYGIPRRVVAHSKGWVLNPETGKHEGNGMWSWDRAKYAALAKRG